MVCSPWLNHSWSVPLYVSASGLTTSLVPHGSEAFELAFDFLAEHRGSSGAADLLEEVDENLRRILHHGQRADHYPGAAVALRR